MLRQSSKLPAGQVCSLCPLKPLRRRNFNRCTGCATALIVQRTALINHTRGLLVEYGLIIPVGASRFRLQIQDIVETAELSGLAKNLFGKLIDEYRDLNGRVSALDDMLVEICYPKEGCKRLTTLPGVGPIVATALVAAIDDGRHFESGRALSAWIGLVPRQYTTGGKPRLGVIGNRANHYLRRQLVHGARSALLRTVFSSNCREISIIPDDIPHEPPNGQEGALS